jgi:hypothetical protein
MHIEIWKLLSERLPEDAKIQSRYMPDVTERADDRIRRKLEFIY